MASLSAATAAAISSDELAAAAAVISLGSASGGDACSGHVEVMDSAAEGDVPTTTSEMDKENISIDRQSSTVRSCVL